MTDEHQTTPEEEAYGRLLDETWELLSEPAQTVIGEAQSAAYAANMVHSYCFQPKEYEEAMEKIHLAAAGLSDRECKLLAKVWRAALAAAVSIEPRDERLVGHKVDGGNLHWYYRMLSDMVEKTLEEKWFADRWDEIAMRQPDDLSDPPF